MSSENCAKVTNILFAGIGGQGIIRASDLLTEAVFRIGYDVKKSELHGMSQRGGSVTSDVRFGEKVASPMISAGETDYFLVLSEDQTEVCRRMLNENTIIIKPSDFSDEDASSRMLNIVMLGRLNRYLKFPRELWETLIRESFSGELAENNIAAFARGEA